jgi:hypothetical protein
MTLYTRRHLVLENLVLRHRLLMPNRTAKAPAYPKRSALGPGAVEHAVKVFQTPCVIGTSGSPVRLDPKVRRATRVLWVRRVRLA